MAFSSLESCFYAQIKYLGLPEPIVEFKFCEGRKWRADFAWPDEKILVEIEGGTYSNGRHTRPEGFRKDCQKYNEATRIGYKVFRFDSKMIRSGEAIEFIKIVLENETIS